MTFKEFIENFVIIKHVCGRFTDWTRKSVRLHNAQHVYNFIQDKWSSRWNRSMVMVNDLRKMSISIYLKKTLRLSEKPPRANKEWLWVSRKHSQLDYSEVRLLHSLQICFQTTCIQGTTLRFGLAWFYFQMFTNSISSCGLHWTCANPSGKWTVKCKTLACQQGCLFGQFLQIGLIKL